MAGLKISSLFVAFAAACLSLNLALTGPASAEPVRTANIETELHSARAAIAPGETFRIVLRQTINEGWHTYWVNPGDSGEPTELTWRLPEGFEVGPMAWPAPEPIPFDILVNYGYSGEVLYPIEITAPASLQPGQSVTLTADGFWLICSDICIPEEGVLNLTLPVEAQGRDDPAWAPRVDAAFNALPRLDPAIQARVSPAAGQGLAQLTVSAPAASDGYFFPFNRDALDHAADQAPRAGERGAGLSLTPGIGGPLGQAPLQGVVTFTDASGARRAVEINAEPGPPLDIGAPLASSAAAPVSALALLGLIAAAFLGGLILNVMPCVLPVLSIKALSFAGGAHAGQARRHGLFYLGGVMLTFLALAGLLVGLRAAGAQIGWGFQLQEPILVSALALLFFVIGLNLLGVFEIGGSLQNAGAGLAEKGGDVGAFSTGALAVIAASPCTAPFMAGAVGAVLTQAPLNVFLVFAGLGLGFAAPFVALSFAPGLQKLLPKPGAWMDRFKHALAFPMFAAAALLVWVLTQQAGANGALALLSVATLLAFALTVARWGRVWTGIGVAALALTLVFAWRPLTGAEPSSAQAAQTLEAQEWTPEKLAELRAAGAPVFVNFTAAWCVSCKVNEAVALSRPRVAEHFAQAGIVYLKGDWTNRDTQIAETLAAHGRAGVPLYLYFAPGASEPVVLPQLLTETIVLNAIEGEQP